MERPKSQLENIGGGKPPRKTTVGTSEPDRVERALGLIREMNAQELRELVGAYVAWLYSNEEPDTSNET